MGCDKNKTLKTNSNLSSPVFCEEKSPLGDLIGEVKLIANLFNI